MAAALTHALGREVRHLDVPPDVYRGFGFPGADDLGNISSSSATSMPTSAPRAAWRRRVH